MLVTALSTPTAYGYWGFALVGSILDTMYGAHRRIHCLDMTELRAGWSLDRDRPVLITTDRPDTALSYMLITSGFPILAFFDGPDDALLNAVISDGHALPEAIRFCSQYFSCLLGCVGSEHVRIFGGDYYKVKVLDLVGAVVSAMGLEVDAVVATQVATQLLAQDDLRSDATVADVIRRRFNGETLANLAGQRLSASEWGLVDWFVANYGPMLTGRECETMEWPRELFFADTRGSAGGMDVEMIGGARHIFWGPYLHLPIGNWRARIQFEVAGNFSGNEIEVDVCMALAQVTRGNATLPVQGYFEFGLDFTAANTNAPIEIRVRLVKAAIEGRFVLRSVTLEPATDRSEIFQVRPPSLRLEAL
jgi:hypothetical protein